MSSKSFKFKQFEVSHSESTMPVGTDAVLLGAWVDVSFLDSQPQGHILDIGCGCGVISLMLAQRCPGCKVCGIDIDSASVEEARKNAQSAQWEDRMEFKVVDIRDFSRSCNGQKYDLVLCNPPYYTEDTLPPDIRRSKARNSVHLTFMQLLESARDIMNRTGRFAVIIPMMSRDVFVGEALMSGFHVIRQCHVHTVSRKPPKRILIEFGLDNGGDIITETITLQDGDSKRSPQYAELCKDFYL